ncbi:hypothetical protein G6F43_001128 [Rhizopus delemar]|nr:hypothetical protein G6F43_001128 [Rhizopus delemar]
MLVPISKIKFTMMRPSLTIHRSYHPPPLVTSTISPGRTGPKRSRIHAAQKPYERPVTRSQSVPPKETIYVPSVSMQVGQTDTMITNSSMDSSSSVTQVDEEPTTPMLQ